MTSPPADLSRLRINREEPERGGHAMIWWALGLVVVAGAAFAIWRFYLQPKNVTAVTVARVEMVGGGSGGGGVGITANGYVVARTRASVSSRVTGRVAELSVEEGSVVRAGQVIARLENTEYAASVAQAVADSMRAKAAVDEAVAQLGQLRRDLARAQNLAAQNAELKRVVEDYGAQVEGAVARLEVQRAQIHVSQAALSYARANLDNTFIRAPFDGTVLRKDAEVGEVVAPVAGGGGLTRGAVVTMANLSTLEVEVDVNEAYIAQIRSGQPAKVVLDAYPTVSFSARVRQIVPTADRQRATVQVKVSLTQRDSRILPEMGARVEFLVPEEAGDAQAPMRIFVAGDAVQTDGGATIVWVVRGDSVSRTVITAGPVSGGRREVTTGLTGIEQVVVKPPKGLTHGARVNVSR